MSNFLASVFGFEARYSVENPTTPLTAANIASDIIGGAAATSGVIVTKETALGYPAVWRGISLISGYVAKIAFPVYKRTMDEAGESGKEKAKLHPAYRLLIRQPNEDMTAFTFKQVLQSHALTHGNGYAAILRDGRGDPYELLLLNPTMTYPRRMNGTLDYVTYVNGEWRGIVQRDVFHLKGLSCDGIMGYSVVDKLRDAIGIGMAAQDFASRFFKNNARPSYAIKLPGALRDDEAVKRFRENINNIHAGPANSMRPMLLEQGAEVTTLGFNNQDSQFLQTREFEVRQIANILGLPPHKLGDSSRTSYNSLEQENQSFLDDTLDFWFGGWEAEANSKLLREKEKQDDTHFCEFHRQSLVRANLSSRTSSYHLALQDGWMNRDEVRSRENLNPIPDGAGKVFLQPLNMSAAGSTSEVTSDAEVIVDPLALNNTPENIVSDQSLNGAQITAALELLTAVVSGAMPELIGTQLLVSLGIEAGIAANMAAAAVAHGKALSAAGTSVFEILNGETDSGDPPNDPPAEPNDDTPQRAAVSHEVRRMLKRVLIATRKAAKKPERFLTFIDGLEGEHGRVVIEAMSPAIVSLCAARGTEQPSEAIQRAGGLFFKSVRESLLTASESQPAELSGAVEAAFAVLEGTLPASLSMQLDKGAGGA